MSDHIHGVDGKRIAYLGRCTYENGNAHRSGMLVLDHKGVPVEFRCTSPVRPNDVQRRLYGQSLEPYMLVEVMGKPLLREIKTGYDLLVVGDALFLNLRSTVAIPVVFLREQGTIHRTSSALVDEDVSFSRGTDVSTVVLSVFKTHEEDRKLAASILHEVSSSLDPMEPFTRITAALDKIHESREMDKK
jgi:hypothetical protein